MPFFGTTVTNVIYISGMMNELITTLFKTHAESEVNTSLDIAKLKRNVTKPITTILITDDRTKLLNHPAVS